MTKLEETTLVLVSTNNNNNKFYKVELGDDDLVTKTWGRVGSNGTKNTERTGRYGYDKVIREKTRKGYKPVDTISENSEQTSSGNNGNLKEIAMNTLLSDAKNMVLVRLIDTLVEKNNHDILETSGGRISVNKDGMITTALGLISRPTIVKARGLLARMEQNVSSNARMEALDSYLTIVPQKVGARKGWENDFLKTPDDFQKQREFLKQLEESLTLHADRKKAATLALESSGDTSQELSNKYADLFKFKISLLEDKGEFKRIEKVFDAGKNSMHSSSHLKLKRVYVIDNPAGRAAFEKKVASIGNVHELWHGTRVWNLLSILRRGLMIAAESISTVQTNGKMFGKGAYFAVGSGAPNSHRKNGSILYPIKTKDRKSSKIPLSDRGGSTKSLNYSSGFWDGKTRDNNCFMFLADVAMGEVHIAQRGTSYMDSHVQRRGSSDSIHAKGRQSNVRNDEIIVWDADQINLKYLCEFGV